MKKNWTERKTHPWYPLNPPMNTFKFQITAIYFLKLCCNFFHFFITQLFLQKQKIVGVQDFSQQGADPNRGANGRVVNLLFILLLPNVMEHRSLLVVYVFIFYQTLRVVPHGMKGTGPRFVTRLAYLRSQFRNNTNTVSTLVPLIHLLQVLCTRYAGVAHHRALQTSGRGWADSKVVHGMECSGARSLYWRSLSVGAAA